MTSGAIAQTDTAAPPVAPASTATDIAARNAAINAPLPPEQAAMKAHVMFLAADELRGRDASSPEFAIAAQYVASQFYAAGLRPTGDAGSYLQRVPLVTYKAADQGSFTLARKGAAAVSLAFNTDYVPAANPSARETRVSAPVVFVGQGIVDPEIGRDDYAGIDAKGAIVAIAGGSPSALNSEIHAHFSGIAAKAAIAAAHGAVGVIQIETPGKPGRGSVSFANAKSGFTRARTTWAEADGTGADQPGTVPVLGTISQAGAAKLFAGARRPWAKIVKQAAAPDPRYQAEALPVLLTVSTHTSFDPAPSSNVVGIIPGADPVVGHEVVVLSAHLDHIGVGTGKTGDQINNGAEDNAVGIASLIEEAKRFAASGQRPRRTIMFLAVTAEEKGLVGSDYFIHHPTVPAKDIVADVNLDMPILTYPFQDVVVFGADRSTLGPIVRGAVRDMGLTVAPDPIPDEAIFVRSDQYRFVQQGVPSVFLWPGPGGGGKAAIDAFLATHYHKPSDDISLPLDWAQGVRFVEVNYRIARAIADGAERPRWNRGDFFGLLYRGYGAKG